VIPTDDVNGAAVGDDQTLQVFKNFTNLGLLTDEIVFSVDKPLSDSGDISDSGLVFAQNYVDNPQYFASDYVGQSQSF